MFTQSCFIRNADKFLIYNIMALGYKPMYMTWRNNIEGNNLVLEYNTWHFTDSDNHPNSIDCGTNEELFLAIAALRDDNDYMQFFTNGIIWFLCDAQRVENSNLYDKEYKIQIKKGCDYHKATVEELIEHFKDK